MKMQLKTSTAKWWQFCPGGIELIRVFIPDIGQRSELDKPKDVKWAFVVSDMSDSDFIAESCSAVIDYLLYKHGPDRNMVENKSLKDVPVEYGPLSVGQYRYVVQHTNDIRTHTDSL